MSPRPDVSEKRRNQILDAATNIFNQFGLHNARVDDIAQEAGLSKGTLYWYFKSKDEIIIAILSRLFERELSKLRQLQYSNKPAKEQLQQFLDFTIEDLRSWLKFVPVAYEFLGLIFRQTFVQGAFKQYLRTYLELLIPIVQKGIDNGEFNAASAVDVSIALGAIIEGTILLWVYDSETVDAEKHMRTTLDIFLKGLLA